VRSSAGAIFLLMNFFFAISSGIVTSLRNEHLETSKMFLSPPRQNLADACPEFLDILKLFTMDLTAHLLEARFAPAHRDAPAPSISLEICGRYRGVSGGNTPVRASGGTLEKVSAAQGILKEINSSAEVGRGLGRGNSSSISLFHQHFEK